MRRTTLVKLARDAGFKVEEIHTTAGDDPAVIYHIRQRARGGVGVMLHPVSAYRTDVELSQANRLTIDGAAKVLGLPKDGSAFDIATRMLKQPVTVTGNDLRTLAKAYLATFNK